MSRPSTGTDGKKVPGGHALVECLKSEGITQAFCVPGESFLAVLDGFY